MKLLVIVILSALITIFGLMRLAIGVQPAPDGVTIGWERSTQPGWSNFSYSIWQYLPGNTNATWLANTNGTNFYKAGAVLDGTMFGVSTIAQSNGVFKAGDIGIAPWPPTYGITPGSIRITPIGGVSVLTGRWVNVSYDMKTNRESLRFQIQTNGTVRVEHKVATDRPYLFMTYPLTPVPPLPGGVQ